jgi:putative transposase
MEFGIKDCCEALSVSRSGYYQWQQDEPGPRAQANRLLGEQIGQVFAAHKGRYGSPRVTRALRAAGVRCGENRVARLMRERGWAARPKRAFRPWTTRAGAVAAPNLIKDLAPSRPDQIWVSDITYVATRQGWLFLVVILDFFSRLVVGWKLGESLEAALVVTALQNALTRRDPPRGLIFHSDQGGQYSSQAVRKPLTLLGANLSMSARGNCYENATAEAFFSTLKAEAFPSDQVFATAAEARRELFEYIEVYYNNQRLHSSLGYQTPRQYETYFKEVIDSRNDSPEVLDAASEDRAMRGRTSSAERPCERQARPPCGGLPAPAGASPKRKIPGSLRDGRPSSPTPKTPKKTENCVSVVPGEVHPFIGVWICYWRIKPPSLAI